MDEYSAVVYCTGWRNAKAFTGTISSPTNFTVCQKMACLTRCLISSGGVTVTPTRVRHSYRESESYGTDTVIHLVTQATSRCSQRPGTMGVRFETPSVSNPSPFGMFNIIATARATEIFEGRFKGTGRFQNVKRVRSNCPLQIGSHPMKGRPHCTGVLAA